MKILIAIDGSNQSETALRFAAQFDFRNGDPPTVLIVIKPRSDQQLTRAEELIGTAKQILPDPNIITRLCTDQPIQEIIRVARENNHDLLIVGGSQDNLLARLLLGFTETRVAEIMPCPVIIVKGITQPIRRILLCDSGSGRSSVLCWFTTQLAELIKGEVQVTVLHVMSQISAGPGVLGHQLRASVDELIDEHTPEGELIEMDLRALDHPGIQPAPKVRHGLVLDEILTESRMGNYDLIVIGVHKINKWQDFLLEDLAKKILVQSDRPVLLVK